MIGRWYIDEIDIFTEYGIGITEGGFNDLFMYYAMKDPDFNDWPEYDGIEVDLLDPKLKAKSASIEFASKTKNNENIDEFLAFIASTGYHTLKIKSLNREWKLRLQKESNRSVYFNGQTFSVQFIDDFPTRNKGLRSGYPFSLQSPDKLDGVSFDKYGIIVESAKESVYAIPDTKANLTFNSKAIDGVRYDTGITRFKEKEVTFKCCLLSDSIDRFWNNYDAFFYDLIQPNERILEADYVFNEQFKCFYRNTSNPKLIRNGQYVALKFDLKLCFTDTRPNKIIKILATDDRQLITTRI